jgi:hypothetical protein
MRTLAVLLHFMICGPADLSDDPPADACEAGQVAAASCAAAEAYVRGGMREQQVLHIIECSE